MIGKVQWLEQRYMINRWLLVATWSKNSQQTHIMYNVPFLDPTESNRIQQNPILLFSGKENIGCCLLSVRSSHLRWCAIFCCLASVIAITWSFYYLAFGQDCWLSQDANCCCVVSHRLHNALRLLCGWFSELKKEWVSKQQTRICLLHYKILHCSDGIST